jgi:hypothetical protein
MKPGDEMIIETALLVTRDEYPFLYCLTPEHSPYESASVKFLNRKALVETLESLSFEQVTCRVVIFGKSTERQRLSFCDDFLTKLADVAAERAIITGCATYTSRYRGLEENAFNQYWFGTHNLNSNMSIRNLLKVAI